MTKKATEEEPRTLEIVTRDLGEADAEEKRNKKLRDKHRLEFFSLAEATVASKTLAQKSVSVAQFDSEEEAREYLEQHYPTWRIIDFTIRDDDVLAVLEEDPEKQPFVFVNPLDKKVYRKQVVAGGTFVNEEKLQREDPELWKRITFVPEPEPQIKSSDELDPKDYAKMQKYVYPGPPQIKLAAPRKAKEHELETGRADD
jgi:hypothetical protein